MHRISMVLIACAVAVGALRIANAQVPTATIEELTKKAQAGDPQAQFRLGSAYEAGRDVQRDAGEAEKWYLRAAEGGYAEAQNSVGSLLQARGQYAEARQWYEKASNQGHALATNNLAYLYDLGRGVPQDRRKGFELYSRAADLGWAEAMWNLANMYGAGQLGKPDLLAACTWTVRAQKHADPKHSALQGQFQRVMPRLQRMLTADQLATCKRDGESWTPQSKKATEDAQPGAATDRPQADGR
jgi:uncharacterized protein